MLLEQFNVLFDRPEKVKKLRGLILQLAVRGKLAPQDEKDEPALVLLQRIREEKERLVKEGKIKEDKPLQEISEDEKPYELPEGWVWERVGNISYITTGGTPPTSQKELFNGGIPFLNPGNIKDDCIIYEGKRIRKEA